MNLEIFGYLAKYFAVMPAMMMPMDRNSVLMRKSEPFISPETTKGNSASMNMNLI